MSLSYSTLQLYRRCPRQYEFACVKKLSRPIGPGESFGSSVHNTLKKWGELELQHAATPVEPDQLTLFADDQPSLSHSPLTTDTLTDLWHQSFIIEGYPTRADAEAARARGEQLMHQFYDWWQQQPRTVYSVEQGFSLEIEGEKVSGRFDRIEQATGGLHVIDYKTARPRTQAEVDADLQLSVYALAVTEVLKQPCVTLTLLFLHADEWVAVSTERSANQIEDARKQIHAIRERIAAQDFHPTPSKEVCKNCPYRGVCDVAAV